MAEEDKAALAVLLIGDMVEVSGAGALSSLNRCYSKARIWRSTWTNRVYGSGLVWCKYKPTWIQAVVKLESPSGTVTRTSRKRSGYKSVLAITYQTFESGTWENWTWGAAGGALEPPDDYTATTYH